MTGSLSYCDQRPWIMNDTVLNNILLGAPYDEARLDAAIFAAYLDDDLKVLPGGLNTQIGEKGVNLSGGQKARVAFARAIYADSDVYLLDDPLAAVDAHVGQFLFRETICKQLKEKTRLLVTHQLQYISYCDIIISLTDGVVSFCGSYDDFRKFSSSSTGNLQSLLVENPSSNIPEEVDDPQAVAKDSKWEETRIAILEKASTSAAERKKDDRQSTITSVEEKDDGVINNSVYIKYIRSGGFHFAFTTLSLMSIGQLVGMGALFWLSQWTTKGYILSVRTNVFYLTVLAVIYCISLSFSVSAIVIQVSHRLNASLNLYMGLLRSILNAPMSFFDTTPLGRILNRFSSDTSVIDDVLPDNVYFTTDNVLGVLVSLLAIAITTQGAFLLLLLPIGVILYRLCRYYRGLNTDLAR